MTPVDRCVPAAHAGVSDAEAASAAAMFKALGSPARLRLLQLIQSAPGGTICACDLATDMAMSRATVSHHLRALVAGGLVRRERRGTWAWYTVAAEGLEAARTCLGTPSVLTH